MPGSIGRARMTLERLAEIATLRTVGCESGGGGVFEEQNHWSIVVGEDGAASYARSIGACAAAAQLGLMLENGRLDWTHCGARETAAGTTAGDGSAEAAVPAGMVTDVEH